MRKHNAPLGKWGRALYRAGLKSHRLRRNGTAEELRRLHEACQNAESVTRLEEESRRLFCSVVRGTFFAEDWDVFVRVKKGLAAIGAGRQTVRLEGAGSAVPSLCGVSAGDACGSAG